ncbi:hypothetical protein GCM10010275_44030 [Streptomyces litmocidini]|nr:hypothetical protein GCM10010275_44030 [Streptomyces litmocidini]
MTAPFRPAVAGERLLVPGLFSVGIREAARVHPGVGTGAATSRAAPGFLIPRVYAVRRESAVVCPVRPTAAGTSAPVTPRESTLGWTTSRRGVPTLRECREAECGRGSIRW